MHTRFTAWLLAATLLASCVASGRGAPADLLLVNARVYTLAWDDPGRDGTPAANAPYGVEGWYPDADTVALRGERIVFVGPRADWKGKAKKKIDLAGATVLPGFVDSHAHASSYGRILGRVDLREVASEEEAVELIAAVAQETPRGQWIQAWGFDEGLWADNMPTKVLLSARVPEHPVHAVGLHGFASFSNELALRRAGISAATVAPVGGEIVLGPDGQPNGVLLNNASELFEAVIPAPDAQTRRADTRRGLQAMAERGYVCIHDAGVDAETLASYQALANAGQLPLRAYLMLSATDVPLMKEWIKRGTRVSSDGMLSVRSVKAYYDASLGSRGARLLADYSDLPGHRGVSGDDYGFDQELVAQAMSMGFQVCIHAIGDAGNRETLDVFERVYAGNAAVRANRNRIEHAQIVDPADQPRFAELDVIASMEPPHAVEDMAWAEERLGPERVRHGYAWRSLREQGARLAFNSDLSGSDPDIFYGLHAAITRRDKEREPAGGWYVEQALRPEEAVRAYTIWNAYAGFMERNTGTIEVGKWADLTVLSLDPLVVGEQDPGALLDGQVLMTIVNGKIAYAAEL